MRIQLPSGGAATVSENVRPETVEALDQMCKATTRADIQRQLDTLDSELRLNYELCQELESRRAELDRQLNPEDYE